MVYIRNSKSILKRKKNRNQLNTLNFDKLVYKTITLTLNYLCLFLLYLYFFYIMLYLKYYINFNINFFIYIILIYLCIFFLFEKEEVLFNNPKTEHKISEDNPPQNIAINP